MFSEIIFLATLLSATVTQELVGYDCDTKNAPIKTISHLAINNCKKTVTNITTSSVKVQLILIKKYSDMTYFSCDIEYKYIIEQCDSFWVGRNALIDSYTRTKQLTKSACRFVQDHKVYKDPHYDWVKIDIGEDNTGS